MDCITRAEIEEIKRRDERLLELKEAIVNKRPDQVVLGGYIITMPNPTPNNKNEIWVPHDRKYRREYAKKASQELRKEMKKITREVLENK